VADPGSLAPGPAARDRREGDDGDAAPFVHPPGSVQLLGLSAEMVRHQRRVALIGAALVVPFAAADLAEGGVTAATGVALAARLLWVAGLLCGAWLLAGPAPRVGAASVVMPGATAACVVVLVAATGGSRSGYFAFLLALPFCTLVIVPGLLSAAVASGVVAAAAGGLILAHDGASAIAVSRWVAMAAGLSAIAVYATYVGGALVRRELDSARARSDAVAALADSERRRATTERLATVGRLAAGVAHEINNPLGFVKANVEFAREHLAEAGQREELAEALADAALGVERIRRIVSDLRGFARADSDEPCGVRVEDAVAEALRLASLRTRELSVGSDLPPGLPPVRICRKRLVQVLVNLLVNAADAIVESEAPAARRWISISAERDGSHVVVRVDDGGPGIPEDVLAHLFEPFFTTKAPGAGTGLGLAVSREYAEAAGGGLAASNGPGGGARFELRVPYLASAPGCNACGRGAAGCAAPDPALARVAAGR
jgi:signal transduction histidine kinase